MVQLLGETFSIHPLISESVVDIHQRPKYEEHDKGNFIILKALSFDKNKIEVKKHVALYFNKGGLSSLFKKLKAICSKQFVSE